MPGKNGTQRQYGGAPAERRSFAGGLVHFPLAATVGTFEDNPSLTRSGRNHTGKHTQRSGAENAEISSASGCRRIEQAVSLPGGEKNGIWARFLGVEAGIENKGLDSDSQASAEKTQHGGEPCRILNLVRSLRLSQRLCVSAGNLMPHVSNTPGPLKGC